MVLEGKLAPAPCSLIRRWPVEQMFFMKARLFRNYTMCSLIKDQFTCTATPPQPEYYRIMCYIAPEQGRPLEIEVALG